MSDVLNVGLNKVTLEISLERNSVHEVESKLTKTAEVTPSSSKREKFIFSDKTEYLLPEAINLNSMPIRQAEKVALMLKNRDAAFFHSDFDLGYCDLIPHTIQLKDNKPVNLSYRRIPPHEVEEVRKVLQEMLDKGIIRKSSSCYGSPIVIVRKKNGSIRLCVDYRQVNEKSELDAFPLPRISEALEALRKSKIFSSLDLAHGYFQVAMDPKSIPVTAFRVPWGLFEFTRLPQGLKNSPSTFQRIMEFIFGDLNLISILLYLDDILIFSPNFEQHIENLDTVLECLIKNGLKLNGKKCSLFQTKLLYLCHVVSENGIGVDPNKIKQILDWPVPKTMEELRSFLGLASYYRKFVKNFSQIVAPLNQLMSQVQEKAGKQIPLAWDQSATDALGEIKQLLTRAPVLVYPDFNKQFVVEVDAALSGLGVCLSQYNDQGELHPVAYASRG